MAATVIVAAGGIFGVAYATGSTTEYIVIRKSLKKGDIDLAKAREDERSSEKIQTTAERRRNELKVIMSSGQSGVTCDSPSAVKVISKDKYKCGLCRVSGQGERYRLQSSRGEIDIHPTCWNHPMGTRSSAQHPQHELHLKTKPRFKKCAVCEKRLGSNIRVYQCEKCEYYVHTTCIQLPQCLFHNADDRTMDLPHHLVLKCILRDKAKSHVLEDMTKKLKVVHKVVGAAGDAMSSS